ncbi:hypothetical protein ABZ307_04015 [Streptomyces griseorubiginosus]|uniref:hypothetical protein n=1 Tax=Streptomyces griseorubiginosus TaxID=67304 RepID=UPI0033BCEB0D
MEEDEDPKPGDYPWNNPKPRGYGQADAVALFIAAPLLTAAALSLAGVVGGADDEFRWPGPILLILVVAALLLVASIQFNYHGRLYLYSFEDLENWLSPDYVKRDARNLHDEQRRDQEKWKKFNTRAVRCFNTGTLLLGVGIAAALVPPICSRQPEWRWSAAVIVLVCTVIDGFWIVFLQLKVSHKPSRILRRLGIRQDSEEP